MEGRMKTFILPLLRAIHFAVWLPFSLLFGGIAFSKWVRRGKRNQ
jgi:hypothetical protein